MWFSPKELEKTRVQGVKDSRGQVKNQLKDRN